ncbi:MAG: hypothetical protein ACYC8T_27105 [Myxococcaceae bacterium]
MLPAAVALWVLCADPTAPFVSSAGGFSALFPGPVREQVKRQASKAGPVETYQSSAETDQMGFLVSWTEHPQVVVKQLKPRERLAAARDAVVGKRAKVLSERAMSLAGNPGLEFRVEKGEGMVVTERVLVVGSRLYQVMVVGPPGASHERAAQIFLDSFKLTGKAK